MRKVKPVNAEGIAVTYTRQDADGGQRVMKDLGPGNSIWSMDPTSTLTKPRTCYHCWRISVVGIKLLQKDMKRHHKHMFQMLWPAKSLGMPRAPPLHGFYVLRTPSAVTDGQADGQTGGQVDGPGPDLHGYVTGAL